MPAWQTRYNWSTATGCEVFILNSELQPARVNEEGEICIGGICLTHGYINRPDLNQTKFIDHPKLNKRLYKTGDLARKLENGDIQFIGRADNQVKLRGFRIELDEIEAVLHEYFGIRQAVVTVHRPPEGVESLVAYLLTNDTKTFNLKKLINFCVHASRLTWFQTYTKSSINSHYYQAAKSTEKIYHCQKLKRVLMIKIIDAHAI